MNWDPNYIPSRREDRIKSNLSHQDDPNCKKRPSWIPLSNTAIAIPVSVVMRKVKEVQTQRVLSKQRKSMNRVSFVMNNVSRSDM